MEEIAHSPSAIENLIKGASAAFSDGRGLKFRTLTSGANGQLIERLSRVEEYTEKISRLLKKTEELRSEFKGSASSSRTTLILCGLSVGSWLVNLASAIVAEVRIEHEDTTTSASSTALDILAITLTIATLYSFYRYKGRTEKEIRAAPILNPEVFALEKVRNAVMPLLHFLNNVNTGDSPMLLSYLEQFWEAHRYMPIETQQRYPFHEAEYFLMMMLSPSDIVTQMPPPPPEPEPTPEVISILIEDNKEDTHKDEDSSSISTHQPSSPPFIALHNGHLDSMLRPPSKIDLKDDFQPTRTLVTSPVVSQQAPPTGSWHSLARYLHYILGGPEVDTRSSSASHDSDSDD